MKRFLLLTLMGLVLGISIFQFPSTSLSSAFTHLIRGEVRLPCRSLYPIQAVVQASPEAPSGREPLSWTSLFQRAEEHLVAFTHQTPFMKRADFEVSSAN